MRTELYQQYSRTRFVAVSTSCVQTPNWPRSEKRDRKSTGTTQNSTGTITAIQRQQPTTEYRSVSLQRFPNFQQQKQLGTHRITHRLLFANYENTLYYTHNHNSFFEQNVPNNTSYFSSQLKRPSATTCHTPLGIRYFCATTTTLTSVLRWCNVVLQLRSLE